MFYLTKSAMSIYRSVPCRYTKVSAEIMSRDYDASREYRLRSHIYEEVHCQQFLTMSDFKGEEIYEFGEERPCRTSAERCDITKME